VVQEKVTAAADKMKSGALYAEQRIEEAARNANERMARASAIISK
jgi:hypothetical protein